jgi:hypothetical protein
LGLEIGNMKLTIHPSAEKHNRSGPFKGYNVTGWDCKEGWLIGLSLTGSDSAKNVWVDGSFESPRFGSVPGVQLDGEQIIEIDPEPVELSAEEQDAILSTIWDWEVWEPVTIAGTCMIESLERMLDLSREVVLDWFRTARRDPSVKEQVVKTLEAKGYRVEERGPEGFGEFHAHRRLVFMFQKKDQTKGHVVLVYEENKDIFDSSKRFKQVGDILWADTLGYKLGSVLIVEKN